MPGNRDDDVDDGSYIENCPSRSASRATHSAAADAGGGGDTDVALLPYRPIIARLVDLSAFHSPCDCNTSTSFPAAANNNK